MAEYIEREALLEEINEEIEIKSPMLTEEANYYLETGLRIARKDIKRLPAADVVEVKHGEWIKDNNFSQIVNKYKCSLCGVEDIVLHHNYCPNCGAKMDLKEGAEE